MVFTLRIGAASCAGNHVHTQPEEKQVRQIGDLVVHRKEKKSHLITLSPLVHWPELRHMVTLSQKGSWKRGLGMCYIIFAI